MSLGLNLSGPASYRASTGIQTQAKQAAALPLPPPPAPISTPPPTPAPVVNTSTAAVNPYTQEQSTLIDVGERMSYRITLRSLVEQAYNRYDCLLSLSVLEVIQA